jgi:hypothetical protein
VATPVGPGKVIVHSRFGDRIFGFDIDQNGTEGVLTEAKDWAVRTCWRRSKPSIRQPGRF